MRIITNPGSNLDESISLSRALDLTPQRIIVDGIPFDTRNAIDLKKVDAWAARSQTFPQIQGTTKEDFVEFFTRIGQQDPELLVIMTSRKLIGSYDAAVAAATQLRTGPDARGKSLRIEVVDTGMTDVGTGLLTLVAAEARDAGLSLEQTAQLIVKLAARQRFLVTIATLDNMVKVGRASFLTGWLANFLEIRPLISFDNGVLKSVGRMKASADLGARTLEHFKSDIDGGPYWLGVAHGDDEARGRAVRDALVEYFKPTFVFFRPISSSIYLGVGRGGVISTLLPVGDVPFELKPPKP